MTEIKIARKFCEILNDWLEPEEIAEINKRNTLDGNVNVCHSHDFCDANEAMIEAFEFFDLDPIDDIPLCNTAWDLAKEVGFDEGKL